MAVIAKTTVQGSGELEMTVTTLGASDTFVYTEGKNATLILDNVSGGPLTPNIDGDAASATYGCPGVEDKDLTGGYTTASIADGEKWIIPLDSIKAYLKGTITVTGGDAMEASILEY